MNERYSRAIFLYTQILCTKRYKKCYEGKNTRWTFVMAAALPGAASYFFVLQLGSKSKKNLMWVCHYTTPAWRVQSTHFFRVICLPLRLRHVTWIFSRSLGLVLISSFTHTKKQHSSCTTQSTMNMTIPPLLLLLLDKIWKQPEYQKNVVFERLSRGWLALPLFCTKVSTKKIITVCSLSFDELTWDIRCCTLSHPLGIHQVRKGANTSTICFCGGFSSQLTYYRICRVGKFHDLIELSGKRARSEPTMWHYFVRFPVQIFLILHSH